MDNGRNICAVSMAGENNGAFITGRDSFGYLSILPCQIDRAAGKESTWAVSQDV